MKRTVCREVLNRISVALLLVVFTSAAYAQRCSNPPPFDDSISPPISPRPTTEDSNVNFWIFGAEAVLDSSSVTRSGNQIAITVYVTSPDDTLPAAPMNCYPVSLGKLPAANYVIVVSKFRRTPNGKYPASPLVLGPYPTFGVAAAALPAPTLSLTNLLLLTAGMALVALMATCRRSKKSGNR